MADLGSWRDGAADPAVGNSNGDLEMLRYVSRLTPVSPGRGETGRTGST